MSHLAVKEVDFSPPPGLRNPHIQNFASSVGLRKWLVHRRTREFRNRSRAVILNCGQNARLQGFYTPADTAETDGHNSLIVLLHGWEGSSDSAYILSAAQALHQQGHAIFRLNFRDHGDSHHLNRELFNSTRLSDVTGALDDIHRRFPHNRMGIAGFSLGGNFALRSTLAQTQHNYRLVQSVAICPVICPQDTMQTLASGISLYEAYFVRKWKESLLKKTRYFSHLRYQDKLKRVNSLKEMNEYFIPTHTPFDDSESYFEAYHLKHGRLEQLSSPTTIITSQDDPIVRAQLLPTDVNNRLLNIELSRYGAHCAFLKNYAMESWVDDRLVALFG